MKKIVAVGIFTLGFSCTEQHKPFKYWEQLDSERKVASQTPPTLTDDGKLPNASQAIAGQNQGPGEKVYTTYCAACHGATGNAKVNNARDFTEKKWQKETDDARILKVIKEGGAAVGLSAVMPAWGALIPDSEMDGLVKKVRSFGK